MTSPYAIAYEASLKAQLTEWADKHEGDAKAAHDQLIGKLQAGNYFSAQGPFGYAVGWNGDSIIAAELNSYLAASIRNMLDDEGINATGTEVLAAISKDMDRQIRDGINASSSGRFHNVVAQSVGAAAININDSSWGFAYMTIRSEHEAKEAVTPDELREERNVRKAAVRELESKLAGARNPHKKELYRSQLISAEAELQAVANEIAVIVESSKV